jgi:eukaryotic-like serine/threonine-protein kinase
MAETGQRVGDYEVIAPLGAGGMGRVFKVRNIISNREEAMKILLPDFASDPDLAARFMAEIRTLATLEHPGIAQLRTAFQYNNQFVMVMEYVEGTTLEKLASQMQLPLGHILDYSMQALAALGYAHQHGVTHRDIKPANLMVTTHGTIKLMDFGIAKSAEDHQLTRPGSTMGSVYYMSPEQVQGGTIDRRSDLYSFGVMLYELLTGRKPFQADTSYTILNAHMHQPPTPPLEVNPAIPPQLSGIVLHALAKNPDDRFQTAEDFRSALREVLEAQTAAVPQSAPAAAAESAWQAPPPSAALPAHFDTQPPAYPTQPQFSAAEPPPFTPVAVPAPPPIAPASPRRGLWLGLGAVIAVAALVAVAWVLPRVFSTHASPKPQAVATDSATPAAVPASQPQPETPPAGQLSAPSTEPQTPASTPVSTVQPTDASQGAGVGPAKPASGARPAPHPASGPRPAYVPPAAPAATTTVQETAAPAAPAGPSPREMRDAHDRFANLEGRADAALAGVDQIRSQQRQQGLDLRGDIIADMNRLHHQLDMARQALAQKDLETATEYMNRAENDTAKLEKFLGR